MERAACLRGRDSAVVGGSGVVLTVVVAGVVRGAASVEGRFRWVVGEMERAACLRGRDSAVAERRGGLLGN